MAIQAFIFDLDGVLTDTAEYHYQSWQQLADEEGIPFTRADNDHLRGISRRQSLDKLLNGRQLPEATKAEWMARKNAYYRRYLHQLSEQDILPGALDFLHRAAEHGIKLGVGSASRNAHDVLKALHIHHLFDAIGDGASVENPKPAPDLFLWVAGRLDVNPAHAIVFEDAESGIEAALLGGFWTVGIGDANIHKAHLHAPHGLRDLMPEALCAHFAELSVTSKQTHVKP